MSSRNDITGDKMQTRTSTDAYRAGWDAVFSKKETDDKEVHEQWQRDAEAVAAVNALQED